MFETQCLVWSLQRQSASSTAGVGLSDRLGHTDPLKDRPNPSLWMWGSLVAWVSASPRIRREDRLLYKDPSSWKSSVEADCGACSLETAANTSRKYIQVYVTVRWLCDVVPYFRKQRNAEVCEIDKGHPGLDSIVSMSLHCTHASSYRIW